MELQGIVHHIGQIEEKGANKFQICKVMLDRKTINQGQEYPNFTQITLMGKKCKLIEERNVAVGDFIKATGDINGRFFTNNEGGESHAQDFHVWNIEIIRKHQTNETKTEEKPTTPTSDVYGQANP